MLSEEVLCFNSFVLSPEISASIFLNIIIIRALPSTFTVPAVYSNQRMQHPVIFEMHTFIH